MFRRSSSLEALIDRGQTAFGDARVLVDERQALADQVQTFLGHPRFSAGSRSRTLSPPSWYYALRK